MERITYQDLPQGMFESLMGIESFIKNSPLPFSLLELVRLRVSQLNGCAYCVDMHHKELQHAGETDLRLSSVVVWQEAPYFTAKEKAVLAFSEGLTQLSGKPLADQVFDSLLSFFSREEIAYLSLAVCQINTWNRLMKAFGFTPGNYQVIKKKAAPAQL